MQKIVSNKYTINVRLSNSSLIHCKIPGYKKIPETIYLKKIMFNVNYNFVHSKTNIFRSYTVPCLSI